MRTIKFFLLACCAVVVTGCKITILANEGGSVVSQSGLNDCPKSTICPIEITSPIFSESFTALPEPGYEFVKWQDGSGFRCGGSVNPICDLTLSGGPLDALAITTFAVIYAMPVFEHVGIDTDGDGIRNELDVDDDNDGFLDIDDACPLDPDPLCGIGTPITDTIVVDGREWAQADLFLDVSWEDMNAVCPAGTCGGALNGHSMDGWIWASEDDLNALFNFYIGSSVLGPGASIFIGTYGECGVSASLADGWRPTESFGSDNLLAGFVRDRPDSTPSIFDNEGQTPFGTNICFAGSAFNFAEFPEGAPAGAGGWFYRTP